MRAVGKLDRLLPRMSEHSENGAALALSIAPLNCIIHCLCTKTSDRVGLQIGCRGFVLRILKAANTASHRLAFAGGANEKVTESAIVVLD